MILLNVLLKADPNARDVFVALLQKTVSASREENGCRVYIATADLDDPLQFHLVELWETEADFLAHVQGEVFKNFLEKFPASATIVSSVQRQGLLEPYAYKRPSP